MKEKQTNYQSLFLKEAKTVIEELKSKQKHDIDLRRLQELLSSINEKDEYYKKYFVLCDQIEDYARGLSNVRLDDLINNCNEIAYLINKKTQ